MPFNEYKFFFFVSLEILLALEDQSWKTLAVYKLLEKIVGSVQIFIGSIIHQTTGIGMHVCNHSTSTIERENLDLKNSDIFIGHIIRLIYYQTILHVVNASSSKFY